MIDTTKTRRRAATLCALACAMAATAAYPAAIGVPEQTARWGLGLSVERVSVDDPDGVTEQETAWQPWNLYYTDRFIGAARYWLHGYYRTSTLPASETAIGQDVSSTGLAMSVQTRLAIDAGWDVFAGAGVYAARSEYENRHNIDSDGFRIATDYAVDRTQTELGGQINLLVETQLSQAWDIAGQVQVAAPFGDGVSDAGVTVIFLYSNR